VCIAEQRLHHYQEGGGRGETGLLLLGQRLDQARTSSSNGSKGQSGWGPIGYTLIPLVGLTMLVREKAKGEGGSNMSALPPNAEKRDSILVCV
jgi:hypothetical protein